MMKLAISPAAASLLRAILGRAGVDRQQVILVDFQSTDWQSHIFVGERHEIGLRVTCRNADEVADRIVSGLDEDVLEIPGHILADIALASRSRPNRDGWVDLAIEALTIVE